MLRLWWFLAGIHSMSCQWCSSGRSGWAECGREIEMDSHQLVPKPHRNLPSQQQSSSPGFYSSFNTPKSCKAICWSFPQACLVSADPSLRPPLFTGPDWIAKRRHVSGQHLWPEFLKDLQTLWASFCCLEEEQRWWGDQSDANTFEEANQPVVREQLVSCVKRTWKYTFNRVIHDCRFSVIAQRLSFSLGWLLFNCCYPDR